VSEARNENETIGQMRDLVDKTIQRTVKGVQFLRASKPEVGLTPKDLIYDRGTLTTIRSRTRFTGYR